MSEEIQERNLDNYNEMPMQGIQPPRNQQLQPLPRNQRKFPIPKQVNYYILHNYALRFYNGNFDERTKILNEISNNIREYGYLILPDEIERRFKNMKAHYRRKRDDYENGLIKSIEWEYYQILDGIFAHSRPKRTYQRIQPIMNVEVTEEIPTQPAPPTQAPPEPVPMIHNAQDLVPKLIIYPNAQVKLPPEIAANNNNTQKRKFNELIPKEIKKEKISPSPDSDVVCLNDKPNNPIDMTMKKKVVIEFNNINDIAQQLPLMDVARTSVDSKHAAVKRISEELKKLDAERINLDEQRLQLEIKRNEIDKAAYTLTQLLHQVANA